MHGPATPLSHDRLLELMGYYQKLLRLQDWQITLELLTGLDWVKAGRSLYNVGICRSSNSNGAAWILMLRFEDIPADSAPACLDLEQTLVHELLHLLMPVSSSDGADEAGELAINKVTGALVQQRRVA